MSPKRTYAGACFEIDLDSAWRPVEDQFVETGEFAFLHDGFGVRLFIAGDLINADGRNLVDLAVSMNATICASIDAVLRRTGGMLHCDATIEVAEGALGVEVLQTAETFGPPPRETLLIVAILHRFSSVYARLSSPTADRQRLLDIWKRLRPDLFLAEPQ